MKRLNSLTLIPDHLALFGADPIGEAPSGFHTRSDVIETVPGDRSRTIDGQPLSEVWDELTERNAAFNNTMDRVTALFVRPVFRAQDRVAVPSSNGFEEATELGRPTKRRVQYVFRGFPLRHVDTAFGYTQEYIDQASRDEIVSVQSEVEVDWTRENMVEVLEAIFTEDNTTDMDGISIKRLYNGDGEVPPQWKSYTHDGNHTHYLTANGPDATDIYTMETHLVHHGFDGDLWLFVNRADMPTVRAMTGFVPAVGADRATVVDGMIVGGSGTTAAPNGIPVQGYLGKFNIVEEDEIPSGYYLGMATGGALSPRNVVGLRFHENPSARGLRLVQGPRQDYPIYDAYYDGYLGAGVRQRGAAVVLQDTAGSYADPTFT